MRFLRSNLAECVLILVVLFTASACTANHPKRHYVLAEKFWNDGNYISAVTEFDKVVQKDPKGKLGSQALYRSAHTEVMFLNRYSEAVKKFSAYSTSAQADPVLAWEAQKQIGDIYFVKTEQYDQAIQHYQGLLRLKPAPEEAAEYAYKIAKSHFYLWQFDEALLCYKQLYQGYPGTPWAEKALYEIALTHYTRGDQKGESATASRSGGAYHEALSAYETYLKTYPHGTFFVQAQFGVASCYEELERLDDAYRDYEALKGTYPAPKVILIKLARIKERLHQKKR